MSLNFKEKTIVHFPEVFLFLVFGLIQMTHINIDFWNDEIYTIKQFILTSPLKTVNDYHVPNNHILFNLINNLYLKAIGVDSLHVLFNTPWKLRIVPFVFSFFTLLFTYKIGAKFVNRTVGLLALIILITTLPYYNFSLQIRGYGLSILLSVMLVYYLLSYFKNSKRTSIIRIGILACLLFYSIPSNLYFLLSIIFVLGIYILCKKRSPKEFFINKYAFSLYAIIAGVLFSILLYFPVLNDIFSNKYVTLGKHFDFSGLEFNVLNIGSGLTHNISLAALSLLGLFVGFRSLFKKSSTFWFSIAIVVVPLIIVWASGQQPPPRVFTFCMPFLSLAIAISIYGGWNKIFPLNRKKDWIVVSIVFLISTISMNFQMENIEKQMLADIKSGGRTQDLYYQYYSARYSPLSDMESFKLVYQRDKLPVVIVGCEDHGIPNYLEKFDIPYYSQIDADSILNQHHRIYVITNHPFKYIDRNDVETKKLNSNLSYHNTLLVRKD